MSEESLKDQRAITLSNFNDGTVLVTLLLSKESLADLKSILDCFDINSRSKYYEVSLVYRPKNVQDLRARP